ncbi:MAG: WxcM-like domain-containing protein [Patescibacteria group bacterium]
MITDVKTETVKKVPTKDLSGNENGFLIEMFKSEDASKTEVYLSCAIPGAFKGYHLHRVRAARYVCLKGNMKVILYVNGKREEHILSAENQTRLFIPPNVPTGLENIGTEDGWLVNYPDPAYDPNLKDEQVDYTQEQVDNGEYLDLQKA